MFGFDAASSARADCVANRRTAPASESHLPRISEPRALKLGQGRNRAGREDDARYEMVRKFRAQRLEGELVRICARFDQPGSLLPDRIVARQEDRSTLLEGWNRIVGWGVHALGILIVLRVGLGAAVLDDQGA